MGRPGVETAAQAPATPRPVSLLPCLLWVSLWCACRVPEGRGCRNGNEHHRAPPCWPCSRSPGACPLRISTPSVPRAAPTLGRHLHPARGRPPHCSSGTLPPSAPPSLRQCPQEPVAVAHTLCLQDPPQAGLPLWMTPLLPGKALPRPWQPFWNLLSLLCAGTRQE